MPLLLRAHICKGLRSNHLTLMGGIGRFRANCIQWRSQPKGGWGGEQSIPLLDLPMGASLNKSY